MSDNLEHLLALVQATFPPKAAGMMSLEEGDQIDSYEKTRQQFYGQVKEIDWLAVTDDYLERFHWGIHHLDAQSWVGYLPALLRYAVEHLNSGEFLVTETLLFSLRPGSVHFQVFYNCSEGIQKATLAVLELLAVDPVSAFQTQALQVIQEYDDYRKDHPSG